MTELKKSNCDQTQKLKLCKIKILNCDNSKTQIVIVIKMTIVTEVVIMASFSKKHLETLTTDQLSEQLFATLAMFFSCMTIQDFFEDEIVKSNTSFHSPVLSKLHLLFCSEVLFVEL